MDSSSIINQKKPHPHVVFIPFPAQSHIKCMLKLAKLLHHKGIQITFINTNSNHKLLVKFGGTRDLDDSPGFQFKTVPDGVTADSVKHTAMMGNEIWTYLKTTFFDSFLEVVSGLETPVTCIICDGFLTFTNILKAAKKLTILIILFWTMASCGFMGVYQAKVLVEKGLLPLKDESYLSNGYLEMKVDWIPEWMQSV